MPFNVGEIPYLNSVPFYWDKRGADPDSRWVSVPPREMGRLARAGEIDAGPLSLIDAFSLEGGFEPLGDFGIAVAGPVRSVLLFSMVPLQDLGGRPLGLTPDSATSCELLKLVLGKKYGVAAAYRTGFAADDAARLLIGDEALKGLADKSLQARFPAVIDLGEEWHRWQGLPFAFARWMVRKSAPPQAKRGLIETLSRNLADRARYVSASQEWFAKNRSWSYGEVAGYIAAFRYRFGAEEARAMEIFRSLVSGTAAAA